MTTSKAYGKTIYGEVGRRPYGEAGAGMVGKTVKRFNAPPSIEGRTYLQVPFNKKNEAKSLGARWDAGAKLWYITAGSKPARFMRWMRAAHRAPSKPFRPVVAAALARAGA